MNPRTVKTGAIAACLAALGAVFAASGFAATAPVRGDGEVPLAPQTAPPDAPPTAPVDRTGAIPIVVALGDSFASGEGGQFAGMIYNNGLIGEVASGRMATQAPQVNAGLGVFRRNSFGQPMSSGRISLCHRSDTAPVNWINSRGTQKYFNLACSGSTTTDIYRRQIDVIPADLAGTDDLAARVRAVSPMDRLELLASARTPDGPRYRIHTITVSIGGNDIGFGPILADCIDVVSHNSCGDTSRNPGRSVNQRLHAGIERARPLITKVLDDITMLMRDNGYTDDQWNLVYVGGPNLFAPSTNRHKVRRGFASRWQSPGVPMTDSTVDWSRDTALPLVQEAFRLAARQAIGPVTFLNLGPAFDGHELSSGSTSLIWCRRPNISSRAARCVNSATPQAGSAEWVVPLDSDFVLSRLRQLLGGGGSRLDQSFHPNRFGQEAIGRCIDRTIWRIDRTRTVYEGMTCRGGAGLRPSQVTVSIGG